MRASGNICVRVQLRRCERVKQSAGRIITFSKAECFYIDLFSLFRWYPLAGNGIYLQQHLTLSVGMRFPLAHSGHTENMCILKKIKISKRHIYVIRQTNLADIINLYDLISVNAYNKEYKICACAPIDDSNQFGEYNIVFHLLELRISALREHKPMSPYVIEKFRTVKITNNLTGTVWRINFSGKIIRNLLCYRMLQNCSHHIWKCWVCFTADFFIFLSFQRDTSLYTCIETYCIRQSFSFPNPFNTRNIERNILTNAKLIRLGLNRTSSYVYPFAVLGSSVFNGFACTLQCIEKEYTVDVTWRVFQGLRGTIQSSA